MSAKISNWVLEPLEKSLSVGCSIQLVVGGLGDMLGVSRTSCKAVK